MVYDRETVISIMRENFFYTMGCTDPVSVILATANAYSVIGGQTSRVKLQLDKNLFKNAFSTMIPGTNEKGLNLAAAIGLTLNSPSKGLLISEDITEEKLIQAKMLLKEIEVEICPYYDTDDIFINVELHTDYGTSICRIEQKHDNITLLKSNDEVMIESSSDAGESKFLNELSGNINIKNLLDVVENINLEDLSFLKQSIDCNMDAAEEGLVKKSGLGLGYKLSELITEGVLEDNLINKAKMYAAGAADARMGGLKTKIAGCFGSGNHGITLLIPLKLLADHAGCNYERLIKGIVLGGIVTAHIKKLTGVITPHCGDIIATGTGVAAGAAYLLGKDMLSIQKACQLVLANLYGVICDGAKPTCSLKIATAVQVGLESAYLADGLNELYSQGVVGKDMHETLCNLDFLIKKAGRATDLHMIQLLETKT